MSERETWATRAGFILAAVGSAVGLGNIWQFPFKTAEFGGATFLVVYLAAVFGIGLPAMLAEFVIGRRSKRNTISAFERLDHKKWRFVGAIGLLTGFWILSYYSVVGGWVLRYVGGSITGAYFGGAESYFGAISAGPEAVALHAIFMTLVVGIVAFGIEDGIEKATKLMVPSILVILGALAVWAFTLPGASEGYGYFLSPDLSQLRLTVESAPSFPWVSFGGPLAEIIPFAVSQAFFSLSLGMGAMITYASYIDGDESLFGDSATIVVFNTLIGILAGLVVIPLLFAQGVEPGSGGAGALFISVAGAFANIPLGRVVGFVFFLVVLVAALSSAISLLEVVVSYAIDNYAVSRPQMAVGLGGTIFLLGLPSAWDTAWLTWFDNLAYQLLLPASVLGILTFSGWVFGRPAVEELLRGTNFGDSIGVTWLWLVRSVVFLAVILTLVLGLLTLFTGQNPAIVPPL
ncbi:sodium-dependent transporter [Halogeometricum borinquense]|uniref:snf family Na+-dependent transporter n=2 Tax=Halogeometricum borinquense TaxID=60847 RepID=E4NQK4_HALBP|nr:sodium-dependent transporter [Halogeometricum borinquense]ADQ66692.1 SNF family Na+-dependent transporter [Halogeometricum borinquense DSM 11551]ELY30201.1 snf family na+-dependent transporter [Halogeometricum borinquense DSM 11551]QIB74997.1 sodium-dependent transporter [Halogeometricum borinquense]QIQ76025.1 sodium-dependent transporter [Halogeometricum borinquense]RYJ14536.1 sodium-dependent transporter [Halogeometricum borinquense]